jgi:hypothetical protein
VPVWVQILLIAFGLAIGSSLIASWWRDRYR